MESVDWGVYSRPPRSLSSLAGKRLPWQRQLEEGPACVIVVVESALVVTQRGNDMGWATQAGHVIQYQTMAWTQNTDHVFG